MTDTLESQPVTARFVGGAERMEILPRYFGPTAMLAGENAVYDWMTQLVGEYNGGYWEFYELSNGAFYMVPSAQASWRVEQPGNYFDGELSADATGIVVTLYALCSLAMRTRVDRFADLYERLRSYAAGHPEAALIFRAID